MRVIENLKPSLDELYHHGVLGMKWGVRKEDQISKKGGIVKAGTNFARYSRSKNEKDNNQGFYAFREKSLEKEFEDIYVEGVLKPFIQKSNKKVYKYSMETKVDLIVPSEKERGKAFVENFLKNKENWNIYTKVFKEKNPADVYERYFGEKAVKELLKDFEKQKNNDSFDITSRLGEEFVRFNGELVDGKVRDIYISSLRSKGYNAILDDNDNEIQQRIQKDAVKDKLFDAYLFKKQDLQNNIAEYSAEKMKLSRFDVLGRRRLFKDFNQKSRQMDKEADILFKEYLREDMKEDFEGGSFIIFDRKDVKTSKVEETGW